MKKRQRERNRELLLSEKGTIYKDPGGRINICLVYPNTYHVGMSNLGFTGLYSLLNRREDVVCERVFLPERNEMEKHKKSRTVLCSLESGRPLYDFDVVGFSVSFENDYPNIVKILSLAHIRPYQHERNEHQPIMVMGGPCAFMNPEPISDFMDVIFVGEAENMIEGFVDILKHDKKREGILKALSRIDGFYVPSFYEPHYGGDGTIVEIKKLYDNAPNSVQRQYIRDLNRNVLSSCITTPHTEFRDMFLIEAMRGCPFSCRFCAAGHIYNPPRQRNVRVLKREMDTAREKELRVGLIAPSLSEYSNIKNLLTTEDVHFSITSLRASRKSADIISLIKDKKSVSIAPEAGSQRLREVINKKITEEDILSTAEIIFKNNIQTLRLYFMVGLPTETDEDVEELVDLTKKIRRLSKKGNITLTLSPFIPKPFTPFQWHPMADSKTIRKRIARIKKGLAVKGVRVYHDSIRDATMQGLFAMGNRKVAKVICNLMKETNIRNAGKKAGIDPDFFIYRQKRSDEILPWDFIDNGVSKEKLWEEYRKALKES